MLPVSNVRNNVPRHPRPPRPGQPECHDRRQQQSARGCIARSGANGECADRCGLRKARAGEVRQPREARCDHARTAGAAAERLGAKPGTTDTAAVGTPAVVNVHAVRRAPDRCWRTLPVSRSAPTPSRPARSHPELAAFGETSMHRPPARGTCDDLERSLVDELIVFSTRLENEHLPAVAARLDCARRLPLPASSPRRAAPVETASSVVNTPTKGAAIGAGDDPSGGTAHLELQRDRAWTNPPAAISLEPCSVTKAKRESGETRYARNRRRGDALTKHSRLPVDVDAVQAIAATTRNCRSGENADGKGRGCSTACAGPSRSRDEEDQSLPTADATISSRSRAS